MSYNITSWQTKKMDHLTIPMEALVGLPHIERELNEDGSITIFGLCEGFEVVGEPIPGNKLLVQSIYNSGEGSGHTWDDFKMMLCKSQGVMLAFQVWEGGDTITMLRVTNGEVEENRIELDMLCHDP